MAAPAPTPWDLRLTRRCTHHDREFSPTLVLVSLFLSLLELNQVSDSCFYLFLPWLQQSLKQPVEYSFANCVSHLVHQLRRSPVRNQARLSTFSIFGNLFPLPCSPTSFNSIPYRLDMKLCHYLLRFRWLNNCSLSGTLPANFVQNQLEIMYVLVFDKRLCRQLC